MEEIPTVRIGLHTSISKSLEQAALKAAELGANTFQIFSTSPRQWKPSMPAHGEIRALIRARKTHDLTPLVIHDNYLINLASADPTISAKSIESFRGELQRAIALEAEYLVAHPGNYKGTSPEQGIMNFLDGVSQASAGLMFSKLMLLVECTVGAGAQIGGKFEELAAIREFAPRFTNLPVGFCLDTCHLLAAGYDVATEAGWKKTVLEADRVLGLENVKVIHANDSKGALGSHIDRHEHIGKGYIGLNGFRRILAHPKLRNKAFILETPVELDGDDQRNLDTLKNLCPKPRTTTTRSS
jgi:deoxyribonuclease IV